jgi:uncharacterized protein (TIGR03067 family)
MRVTVIALVVTVGLTTAAGPADDKALEPFQGKWEIVEASERGQAGDPEKLKMFPVTFSGNQMELIYEGKKTVKWTITVRADKDPKEIDATLPKDLEGGKTVPGIYRFEEGVLRIALGLGQEPARPQKFESVGGGKPTFVMVLKKAK